MKDETTIWLDYAKENLESAKILVDNHLNNSCLQNVQQSVEKALKAVLVEISYKLKRTHSINELKNILEKNGITCNLTEEECDFLDSIYLPSKYPLSSVLPYYEPNKDICNKGISIAHLVLESVQDIINRVNDH